jgi:nitroreductase
MTPYEFLVTRRSIPAAMLALPAPDAATLERILTVATRVPDHGKLGPWRFIVWEGAARSAANAVLLALRRRRNPDLPAADAAADEVRFTRAPMVIGLVSRPMPSDKAPEWEQLLSAGAVGMNLLNGAHALGFAANWLTDWPVYDAEAGAILGLKPGERFAGFIHVGTPTAPPQERYRPSVADLVTRWQQPD